jgi:thioredoxin reductase (NADPH)
MKDVIIIGAGPGGLSAAAWCSELGLETLVLEANRETGGQLLWTHNPVHNHLGATTANGTELRDIFLQQLEPFRFELRLNAKVKAADLANKKIILETGEILTARAIILATGIRRKKLNIGEDKFVGRGLLESGKRDRDTVRGKNVAIIGGGDAACENALILAETATNVTLIHRRQEFRARRDFLEQIAGNPKIKVLTETVVTKIIGKEQIEAIKLCQIIENKSYQIPVSAILLRIGVEPNTEFLGEALRKDKNGYIEINSCGETNLENIYAIGDAANPLSPTVSTAVGMGATAAKVLYSKLNL